jgi:NADP-dependent 3-hydroxy acid dehydrogenase YdfG
MTVSTRVVVVTGASSGIGAALATLLGSQGHAVVLAARRKTRLARVAQEIGAGALPVVTDVTRREEVEGLRDSALREFGRVDVWVSNAGRGITKTVLELTDADLDDMLSVNLRSALYGMQAIIPHFQERGQGHLINVSSFLGRVPLVTARSAYNAAKSALNVLTANLRMDLRVTHPGIHVSLVMPGMVATEFHAVAGSRISGGARRGPGAMQSAEEVAGQIASLIEHPVPELYTNPASAQVARRYYEDVGAFEEQMVGDRA